MKRADLKVGMVVYVDHAWSGSKQVVVDIDPIWLPTRYGSGVRRQFTPDGTTKQYVLLQPYGSTTESERRAVPLRHVLGDYDTVAAEKVAAANAAKAADAKRWEDYGRRDEAAQAANDRLSHIGGLYVSAEHGHFRITIRDESEFQRVIDLLAAPNP